MITMYIAHADTIQSTYNITNLIYIHNISVMYTNISYKKIYSINILQMPRILSSNPDIIMIASSVYTDYMPSVALAIFLCIHFALIKNTCLAPAGFLS